tara:strand:- start:3225 stop:3452 length:228 start_codon:yes stop_codon:yes gene_type:complete
MNKQYYTQKDLSEIYNVTPWKISNVLKKNKVQAIGKIINKFGVPAKVYSGNDIKEEMFKKLPVGTIILNDGTILN